MIGGVSTSGGAGAAALEPSKNKDAKGQLPVSQKGGYDMVVSMVRNR